MRYLLAFRSRSHWFPQISKAIRILRSVDAALTMVVGGNCVKVIAWYDNEWGYSCRVCAI